MGAIRMIKKGVLITGEKEEKKNSIEFNRKIIGK